MTNDQIQQIALANGFKLKEQPDGSMALNPYVFDFARALLAAAPTKKNAAVAAIKFAIFNDAGCEARTFLELWLHGNFAAIRREWDNVPDDVFICADPLFNNTAQENK